MTYVVTQSCCNDASCVSVCPVDCIHPRPDEPTFMSAEMLFVDPATCIDCGACADECPVDAIRPDIELSEYEQRFEAVNAAYYVDNPINVVADTAVRATRRREDFSGLRVAIVGSGPAACYAAAELALLKGVEVDIYDRLLTPYGLIRSGVAPDHQGTKKIATLFKRTLSKPNVRLHLGVEIGKDLSHSDLLATHSAVIYAVGASGDRKMGIPGETLPGSHAVTEFVAWYNGSPEHADSMFDLSGERAVIVGNGNVAMDVARILLSDPERLAATDIADRAIDVLRDSNIREVVILGRRGPAQAAYTNGELLGLMDLSWVDLVIDPEEVELDETMRGLIEARETTASVRLKTELASEIAARPLSGSNKRIVLRYRTSPVEVLGENKVASVRVQKNSLVYDAQGIACAVPLPDESDIECGLVLRSIGYRGVGLTGVPFDEDKGIIPNLSGRVVDGETGEACMGTYAVGWIKRGPSGVIGTNKKCARESVTALLDDFVAGTLRPMTSREPLESLLKTRCPQAVDRSGWNRIDSAERKAGAARGKPRAKFVDTAAMLNVAHGEV